MTTFDVTFDYAGIECPATGEPLSRHRARWQFAAEFLDALTALPPDVLGYRYVADTGTSVIMRFIVAEGVDAARLVHTIQESMYDFGGLSGEFTLGVRLPF